MDGDNGRVSTYPGDDQPPPHDDGTEPTQPVGYWERQAFQQSQAHEGPQSQYSPQAFPQASTQPLSQPPPAYGGPLAAPSHAPAPPPYGAPGAAPGFYGAPPPYAGYAPPGPDHPRATLSMVLGIVGLFGVFSCGLSLLVAPFAWALGRGAVNDIRASQGRIGGHGQAMAGMVLGIIGTVLLVLLVLAVVAIIVVIATTETSSTGTSTI